MHTPRLASLALLGALAVLFLNSGGTASDLTSGLIAYYPFNGNANDVSGNANHGMVHGATLVADRCGNPDRAYFFNRANADWIEVPHNAIQNTPVNAGLTLSLWIHPNDASPTQALITKQPSGSCALFHGQTTSNHGGLFDVELVAAQPSFTSQFADFCGSEGHISQISVPQDYDWHHLVITVDVTNPLHALAQFYIDGQHGDTQVYGQFGSPILSQPSAEPIRIGARKDSVFVGSGPAYFWGAMDDIRIYNRPLTETEVVELHREEQCLTPFATFAVSQFRLHLGNNQALHHTNVLHFAGEFTLANTSNGIDPVTENVSLVVGTWQLTLAGGSFQAKRRTYVFSGEIDGQTVEMTIFRHNKQAFDFSVDAKRVIIGDLQDPLPLSLTIGTNTGKSQVDLIGTLHGVPAPEGEEVAAEKRRSQ
jgi:hypothetical protein